jgi:hypothetical protein
MCFKPIAQVFSVAVALMAIAPMTIVPSHAQTDSAGGSATIADLVSARVLSVVSGGYWEGQIEPEAAPEADESAKPEPIAARGYYRIVAVRSKDNTSRLFLQRIRLADGGPDLVDTSEITALTDMKAYITDMRPESSTGQADRPGFAAFVYLKLDPAAVEPDTFELFVDDFGDVAFTPATN